jgi:hypothetical protein
MPETQTFYPTRRNHWKWLRRELLGRHMPGTIKYGEHDLAHIDLNTIWYGGNLSREPHFLRAGVDYLVEVWKPVPKPGERGGKSTPSKYWQHTADVTIRYTPGDVRPFNIVQSVPVEQAHKESANV